MRRELSFLVETKDTFFTSEKLFAMAIITVTSVVVQSVSCVSVSLEIRFSTLEVSSASYKIIVNGGKTNDKRMFCFFSSGGWFAVEFAVTLPTSCTPDSVLKPMKDPLLGLACAALRGLFLCG